MADLSHRPGDITAHPDVHEMRVRYARMAAGREARVVDGLVLLAGLYCAISPWTVHFSAARPELLINNLIVGLAIALMGMAITAAPARLGNLSWTLGAMGVWLIISPWVVTRFPDAGVIWNQVVIGAVTCLLALVCAAVSVTMQRPTTET